jgi:hypothetical protein
MIDAVRLAVAIVVMAPAMALATDAVAAPPWYVPPDNDTNWIEWAQLLGVIATLIVLGFNAYELRATARERKRLRLRIQQERLEELATAIAGAMDTARIRDSSGMATILIEIGARAIPLPKNDYKAVWRLAEEPFDPKGTAWTDERETELTALANDALDEVRQALTTVATADA